MEKPAQRIMITRANIEDLSLIAPLFDEYRQFYQQMQDLQSAHNFLAERLTEHSSVIFLAYNDDQSGTQHPCGFTQLYPSFSSVSLKRLWILNDLFVAPEARGLGVGKALLERARAFAEETQAKGLLLTTARDNTHAQHVYKQAGWQRDEAFYTYQLFI